MTSRRFGNGANGHIGGVTPDDESCTFMVTGAVPVPPIEIANGLKTAEVGFRALTEPMDIATPHGELLFHLFGALAQYERALTQERIRAGLAAARRGGAAG